jgi:hypothetical protein
MSIFLVSLAIAQPLSPSETGAQIQRTVQAHVQVVGDLKPTGPAQEACIAPHKDALAVLDMVTTRIIGQLGENLTEGHTAQVALGLRKLEVTQARSHRLLLAAQQCIPDPATTTVVRIAGAEEGLVDGSDTAASPEPRIEPAPPSASPSD